MNEQRIAVVGEDHRPVGREERVELTIRKPVGVLGVRLQPHEVDHVDHPDLQVGQVLMQQVHRGQGFERGNVTTARHDDIGHRVIVIRRERPYPEPSCAVLDGLVHAEPIVLRLFACDDDVHVVATAKAVVCDR